MENLERDCPVEYKMNDSRPMFGYRNGAIKFVGSRKIEVTIYHLNCWNHYIEFHLPDFHRFIKNHLPEIGVSASEANVQSFNSKAIATHRSTVVDTAQPTSRGNRNSMMAQPIHQEIVEAPV